MPTDDIRCALPLEVLRGAPSAGIFEGSNRAADADQPLIIRRGQGFLQAAPELERILFLGSTYQKHKRLFDSRVASRRRKPTERFPLPCTLCVKPAMTSRASASRIRRPQCARAKSLQTELPSRRFLPCNTSAFKPTEIIKSPIRMTNSIEFPSNTLLPRSSAEQRGQQQVAASNSMHRCVFTVWALPVEKLDVPAQAGCPVAGFTFNARRSTKPSSRPRSSPSKRRPRDSHKIATRRTNEAPVPTVFDAGAGVLCRSGGRNGGQNKKFCLTSPLRQGPGDRRTSSAPARQPCRRPWQRLQRSRGPSSSAGTCLRSRAGHRAARRA